MCKHVCLSKYNIKTIFVDFLCFYGILLQPKRLSFNPLTFLTQSWLTGQVGRLHGRPHQGLVDLAVDRRAQSCARLAAQWAGRPDGRPDQRALLSVSGRSTERSNGRKFDRWRSTGRSTDRPDRPQRLVFLSL